VRDGTSVEVVLFGEVLAYIPQVGVMSTSLGALPRPVPRPLPWRHPTGFAGVFHATVSGLVVGWLAVVEVVDAGGVECVGMGVGSGWWPVPWAMCRGVVAPPARRYPTGFAGVAYATNRGLVVGRSGRRVAV